MRCVAHGVRGIFWVDNQSVFSGKNIYILITIHRESVNSVNRCTGNCNNGGLAIRKITGTCSRAYKGYAAN